MLSKHSKDNFYKNFIDYSVKIYLFPLLFVGLFLKFYDKVILKLKTYRDNRNQIKY